MMSSYWAREMRAVLLVAVKQNDSKTQWNICLFIYLENLYPAFLMPKQVTKAAYKFHSKMYNRQ